MVEYNDWNCEKGDSAVVVTLEGERWNHVDGGSDRWRVDDVEKSEGC